MNNAAPTITYNNIENNSCETGPCAAMFFYYGGTARFENNNIGNTGPKEINVVVFGSITAASNYWNLTSEADVSARISAPGTIPITISPILTSRVSGTGPRPP